MDTEPSKYKEPAFVETIAAILADRQQQQTIPADRRTPAAVALIMRQGSVGPEVLFIERAHHEGDPWSGDLGFPGGKVEAFDADPYTAAQREAREEIGIDLAEARYLGCLAEITGATLPVRVTCFVYALDQTPDLSLNREVQDAFWVSLADLRDMNRHVLASVRIKGNLVPHPAIMLPVPGKPPLWGLTYRLVQHFVALLPPHI